MQNNIKYIYHHLGMGDHISCHGIVRHYCEIESKLFYHEYVRGYSDRYNSVGKNKFIKIT